MVLTFGSVTGYSFVASQVLEYQIDLLSEECPLEFSDTLTSFALRGNICFGWKYRIVVGLCNFFNN